MRCRRTSRRGTIRRQAAFTLAEVLAALLLLAIVVPVAIQGLRLAGLAGVLSQRRQVAARVAEQVLNETALTGTWSSAVQNGTMVPEDSLAYRWHLEVAPWGEGLVRLATVQVFFEVQGQDYDVRLDTLIDLSNPMKVTRTNCPSRESPRGFTFLEVLCAVGVFALVLLAIQGMFFTALQFRNRTDQAITDALPLEQAVTVLRRDLSHMVLPGGLFAGDFVAGTWSASATNTSSLNDLSVPASSKTASFCTAVGVIDDSRPWGDFQRVFYFLSPSTNGTSGSDLYRGVTRNFLPIFEDETERQWLLQGVSDLRLSFYDGLQWREDWDSTVETNSLPRGVRLELELEREPAATLRSQRLLTVVVPLLVRASTNDTSSQENP